MGYSKQCFFTITIFKNAFLKIVIAAQRDSEYKNHSLKQRVLFPGPSLMQLNHCGMLEKNKFAPLFLPQKKEVVLLTI